LITDIKAEARQTTPVVSGEGDQADVKMTRLGALYTADWKLQLIAAGLAYSLPVGTVAAGGDFTAVVGGGNGTTIDSDQPELVIGVDAGYYLIPMECSAACYADPVTDNGITQIALFADRSQAPVTANASGTAATPVNLLDGSTAFPGRAWTASTGDITDPVCSEMLDYACNEVGCTTGGSTNLEVKLNYKPDAPSILAGPCQVVLCWGGTAAASGGGIIKVAAVPASYFA
jgi:hypothetical protein